MTRPHSASPPRPVFHIARAVLLTFSSAAPAIAAHAAAGGISQAALTALLTPLIGWLATVLADRVRGMVGMVLVLSAAQMVMHVLLGGHGALSAHVPGTMAGLGGDAVVATAHIGAVALTAVLLARAESMLAVAAAALRVLLPVVSCPAPVSTDGPLQIGVRPAAGPHLVEVLLRRVHRRRGPPTFS